jgi:hypothetical protein
LFLGREERLTEFAGVWTITPFLIFGCPGVGLFQMAFGVLADAISRTGGQPIFLFPNCDKGVTSATLRHS